MSSTGLAYAIELGVQDPIAKLALLSVCDQECDGRSHISIFSVAKWCCGSVDLAFDALDHLEAAGIITFYEDRDWEYEGEWGKIFVSIHDLAVKNSELCKARDDGGRIPLSIRRAVYERDGTTCKYCGEEIEEGYRTLDHVVPRSRGGAHDPENLVVCCRSCNSSKGAKTLDEWGGGK